MANPLPAQDERVFTYNDYLEIEDRAELIDGEVYMMASPKFSHQKVAGRTYSQFEAQLEGKRCTPLIAPFDVRLFYREDGLDKVVVQPDIMIICDPGKIDVNGGFCKGAPDFVIEVLSESTRNNDLLRKYNRYMRAGVKEYWIIDVEMRLVYISILEDDGFYGEMREVKVEGKVPLVTLDALCVDFDRVFAGL
jgi:Uma2 family endonuclease